jgi:D-xylose transport system permease protein
VRGLVLTVTNGRSLMVEDPTSLATMTAFESGRLGTIPYPVLYMAVFTLVIWFVLNFTVIGRRIYAVGGNAEAARLSGINVRAYKLGAFVLSSLAAGFAGVLFGCRFGAINPTALQGDELTVIAAAILGGTSLFGGAGSVVKTLAGALLLFTLTNGFNILNLGANYQGLIEGAVLVVAAAIYTVGGKARARKPVRATSTTPLAKEAT